MLLLVPPPDICIFNYDSDLRVLNATGVTHMELDTAAEISLTTLTYHREWLCDPWISLLISFESELLTWFILVYCAPPNAGITSNSQRNWYPRAELSPAQPSSAWLLSAKLERSSAGLEPPTATAKALSRLDSQPEPKLVGAEAAPAKPQPASHGNTNLTLCG